MGNFYVNHTIRAPRQRVADFLESEGHTAFVSPTTDGLTVVCDKECDDQDTNAIRALGRKLSSSLESPVLAILNHDDDILCYWLFEEGELIEEYNSCPDYFDGDEFEEFGSDSEELSEDAESEINVGPNRMSDGEELCRVFGNPERRDRIRSILTGERQVFAVMIHQELVAALGLPSCTIGSGYRYVAEGDAALDRRACLHVGQGAGGHQRCDAPDVDE